MTAHPATEIPMPPLDRLVAQDDIRQQLALFALLLDGDAVAKGDRPAFARRLFAADAVTEIFSPEGAVVARMSGHAEIGAVTYVRPKTQVGRHFLAAPHFDAVTRTQVATRTPVLYLELTNPADEAGKPGQFSHATLLVYHHQWVKTEEGWRILRTALRRDN